MSAKHKYSEQLKELCDSGCMCPPPRSKSQEVTAYRFVRQPCDKRSFVPQAVTDPLRVNREKKQVVKCSLYGLSMHKLEAGAKDFYEGLRDRFKNDELLAKLIGTHLAVGTINRGHGVCTQPAQNGHFDLHEYENSSVESAFVITAGLL